MSAWFLKLLNMSAAGSVLILAVVVLRALLRKAPRWLLCAMWALAAIRLVCPFSLSSPLSAFRAAPSIVSESGEVEVFRPAGGSEKPLLAVDTVQIERPRTDAETIREIPGTSYAVTQRSRDAYLPPLVQAYLLGLAAMLLYTVISTLLLRKRVSASLRRRGNVRVCDELASPFILGIVRPVIYLPSSLSEEERRYVLAHERAHLRRWDQVWKPLGFLILSVHWFNPFCWLAYVLLGRDIELACDERVIRELGRTERAAYSQTLLNCSAHRILAACPVAFGETDVKTRVKAVLNYKKPAFRIVLAAVLGCVVLILCFAAKPMPGEPDLSFLNYKNAIPLIGQNDTAPYANLYPADSDGVQPGVADSRALVQLLESAKWTKRRAPSSSPEPRGFIEFMIEDDYRIIVYQSERLAAVCFGNDIRYYRTAAGDYEAALAAFIPAPSTEPDRRPEQSPLPAPEPPEGPVLPEDAYELVPADPKAFLLGFADAEIVSLYEENVREYTDPDRSFTEIISAETWTAHVFNEFPASIADRLIIMRSGDWELRIEDDGEDCLYAAYAVGRGASDPIIYFDCGENLMDELMAWALRETRRPTGAADSFPSRDGTAEYCFGGASSFKLTRLPVVEVAPHEITAEEAARLADALFPDAVYSGYVFEAPRTKADLQASMERWRSYLSDGTLDDLLRGDEEALADMEKVFGRWEESFAERLAQAPETETRTPAQWVFRPDSEVWAGGDPGTETIRAIVDCGGLQYGFCAANRTQGDFSLHALYASLCTKSSPNNVDALLRQYELCRSPRPTEAQLAAIREKARAALTALDAGEWSIDRCLVERLPRGREEAYVVTVKAVPVLEGSAAIRFAQLSDMRSGTEGAQHFYYTDASFSFAPDGTLLEFSVYSPVDLVAVRDDGGSLGADELLEAARALLRERGLDAYDRYYPTDRASSAKVYIDRMTYGLARIEAEKGRVYRYVPALCLDGRLALTRESGQLFSENTADGRMRLLVLNALDGTEIVFSSDNGFTAVP